MSKWLDWLFSRAGRKWLYSVAVAAIPVIVLYGVIDPKDAPAWLALVAALLGVAAPAMALRNLPPKDDDDGV